MCKNTEIKFVGSTSTMQYKVRANCTDYSEKKMPLIVAATSLLQKSETRSGSDRLKAFEQLIPGA